MLAHEIKNKADSIIGIYLHGLVRRILSGARDKLARPCRVLSRDYAVAPTEAAGRHGWFWHATAVIQESGAFWPRFMDALGEDATFQDGKRLAAYFGMEALYMVDQWPDVSIDNELMDVIPMLPAIQPKGTGWFIAGIWETDDGDVARLFLRPLTDSAEDLRYGQDTLPAVFGYPEYF